MKATLYVSFALLAVGIGIAIYLVMSGTPTPDSLSPRSPGSPTKSTPAPVPAPAQPSQPAEQKPAEVPADNVAGRAGWFLHQMKSGVDDEVLDLAAADPDYGIRTMPIHTLIEHGRQEDALGYVRRLRDSIEQDELSTVVIDLAAGLDAAGAQKGIPESTAIGRDLLLNHIGPIDPRVSEVVIAALRDVRYLSTANSLVSLVALHQPPEQRVEILMEMVRDPDQSIGARMEAISALPLLMDDFREIAKLKPHLGDDPRLTRTLETELANLDLDFGPASYWEQSLERTERFHASLKVGAERATPEELMSSLSDLSYFSNTRNQAPPEETLKALRESLESPLLTLDAEQRQSADSFMQFARYLQLRSQP